LDNADFAGINTTLLTRFVRDTQGATALTALLAAAGETRTVEELANPGTWSSYAQFRRLLEAAAEQFGGIAFVRRAAGSGLDDPTMPEMTAMLQSLGSPDALMEVIVGSGSATLAPIIAIDGARVGPEEWVVNIRFVEHQPFAEHCAWSAGLFTSIPGMFGRAATVVEESCACEGAPHCTLRVRWDAADVDATIASLQQQNQLLLARLEGLQETVAQLVSSDDLEVVLGRIIDSAAQTISAPRFVLALDDLVAQRRVYSRGLAASNAELEAMARLDAPDDERRHVAEVASGRRRYGRLVAMNPGAAFLPQERLVLEAHARLAAAALDSASALADARREAETSRILLQLSTTLAQITSSDEVASTIAQAVPAVTGCDRAAVVLFDLDLGTGRIVATDGYSADLDLALRSMTVPVPQPKAGDNGVIVWDRESAAGHQVLSAVMDAVAAAAIATVPIVVGVSHVGLVVADVTDDPERLIDNANLHDRLRGLAGQASIAVRNARLLDEIRHQALHDSLTGLPNRTLILDRVERMLARARRTNEECAVLFVDLDGFKQVNDTMGHDVGDRLLQAVAARLSSALRQADSIGRLGGDEFVVLVEVGSSLGTPEFVAERLMDVLSEPFDLDGVAPDGLVITASIGIAMGNRYSAADLLRDADIALYEAKGAGRNCYVRFARSMQTAVEDRLVLELDLRAAIAENQFFLQYQPIFDLETGGTIGLEALIRWNHPRRGLVQPNDFVPVLEETKLIVEVGRWVLREACKQAVVFGLAEKEMYLSVNVSARQFDDDTFRNDVKQALEDSGLPPERLVLEVTETAIMRDPMSTAHRLGLIKQLGVSVAVDDFGTGYSSLSYLREFPIDILKIDRSFISSMEDSNESIALVRTLVNLGRELGLQTLAEGIEQHAQFSRLQDENCDAGQGYIFARPLDSDDVMRFLADEAAHRAAAAAGEGDAVPTDVS
jgi:diguanylate cyclase (GGDEF)-like protein